MSRCLNINWTASVAQNAPSCGALRLVNSFPARVKVASTRPSQPRVLSSAVIFVAEWECETLSPEGLLHLISLGPGCLEPGRCHNSSLGPGMQMGNVNYEWLFLDITFPLSSVIKSRRKLQIANVFLQVMFDYLWRKEIVGFSSFSVSIFP